MRQPAVASIRADPPRAGFRYPMTALRGLAPARCQLQVDMVCRCAWAYCSPRSGLVPRPRPELTNWRWRWRSSRRCPRRGARAGEGRGPGLDQPFNPDQLRGGERGLALDCGGVRCRLIGGHGTGSRVGELPGPMGKRNRSEKKEPVCSFARPSTVVAKITPRGSTYAYLCACAFLRQACDRLLLIHCSQSTGQHAPAPAVSTRLINPG